MTEASAHGIRNLAICFQFIVGGQTVTTLRQDRERLGTTQSGELILIVPPSSVDGLAIAI